MKMSEYKQLFLSEAEEILGSLNMVLVEWEKKPENSALINELFRHSHTLKSMAQSMEYQDIVSLTHSMEAYLARLRSGKMKPQRDSIDLLFKSVDVLNELIDGVKKGGQKKTDVSSLISRFEENTPLSGTDAEQNRKEDENIPVSAPELQSVRVPLSQLDSLMDLAGELAINKDMLSQISQGIDNKALNEIVAQTSRLISQLQDRMMDIRLVPLEYIFTPYPRMVRDMAAAENKDVDLVIEGSDIGLDRTIQEEINEPLLHLLKNALIHGIEKPEKRENMKKPARGMIQLKAKRERNFVQVEVADDGQGIDIDEIKKAAIEKGIITQEDISNLDPKDVLMLIVTSPGYSGAKRVTETAGMGVGLNIVRTRVESFGGTFTIDTRKNEGTTCIIKLPVTMSMIQSILVGVADETYCIPLSLIVETIKVRNDEIKTIEQNQVICYQNTILPLIELRQRFRFPVEKRGHSVSIVVVDIGHKRTGLIVDSFLGKKDIVIKPLTGVLKGIKGVSGATILGTGKAAFIVDVASIVSEG